MKIRQKHRGILSFILTMAMLTAEIYPLSMPLAVQAEGEEYVVIDEENSVSAEEVLADDNIQEDDEDIAEEEILEATPESAFEWDGDVITGYLGGGPDVVIPKRAIAIGREAFQKNTDIQRLFFEEGSLCKSISTDACYKAENLTYVVLPESLEIMEARAFAFCDLKEIIIPENVTTIWNNVFSDNKSLSSVTINSKNIEQASTRIFNGCAIERLSFTEGITKIPDDLFSCADFVEGYRLVIPDNVTEIGTDAFALCGNIVEVHFPDGLETIGARAFYSCDIKEVIIPETVKEIKNNAFHNNTSLWRVAIKAKNMDTGIRIFSGCSINSITFPEGITKIPSRMFAYAGVAENTTITIPDSVTVIGSEAFTHIDVPYSVALPKNLEEIEFAAFSLSSLSGNIVFPLTLRKIVNAVFLNCNGLQKVTYAGSEKKWNNLDINKNGNDPILPPDEFLNMDIIGFNLTKDGYCVPNSYDGFKYQNVFNSWDYKIPLERYQEVYGKDFDKHVYKQYKSKWGGNCLGMSSTAVLFYENELKLSDYIEEDKNGDGAIVLTDDGYDELNHIFLDYAYCRLYKKSQLTKLIEQYQIWQKSAEYQQLIHSSKTLCNENPSDLIKNAESYESAISDIKTNKTPYILIVQWAEERFSSSEYFAHALVVDSSRRPVDLGDGWVRIFLYDPNNPFFGSFGNKAPKAYYNIALDRYIDLNIDNGYWRMNAYFNSDGKEGGDIGYDSNGNIKNSSFVMIDPDGLPNNFNTKAKLSQDNSTTVAYSCNDFTVYDSNDVLLYQKENGKTVYIDYELVNEYKYTGYVEGIDSISASGSLVLPEDRYKVIIENGTISFRTNGDYVGVAVENKPVTVVNTSSSSLSVSAQEMTYVDLVVEETEGENKYTSVQTDVIVGEAGCDISLEGNKLNINTNDEQKFDVDIIADNGYGEAISISSNDVKDLDLNELISDELKGYTITYELDGGTVSGNPTSYNRETGTFTLENPTKDGFEFLGWTGSNGDIPETYVVIGLGEKGDRTYKANWNDGSSVDPAKPDNGAAMNPAPVIDENTKELHLIKGQKFTLTESGWTSSNKKCLAISKKNVVTVKKATTTPVKLTKGEQSIDVYITKPAMGAKSVSLKAGEERQIAFDYDSENLSILWYSSAPDVATISQNGVVSAHSKGTATITAYIYGKSYTCKVKVAEPQIAQERTLHIALNKTKKISLKGIKKPIWKAEDESVVGVKGTKFKGLKAGETVVSVEYEGKTYHIHVYVEDPTINVTELNAKGKDKYTATLKVGDEIPLVYNFVQQDVVFKSSKSEVAYWDDGAIIAQKPGKTKLTAKINGKTVTITVTVQ